MPEEGTQWVARSEILTFEELERLARIFVERLELDGLRLTGGEPPCEHSSALGSSTDFTEEIKRAVGTKWRGLESRDPLGCRRRGLA